MDFGISGLDPAKTHYYQLLNVAGLYVRNNGQAAEALDATRWTQYAFGASLPNAAGLWQANMPAGRPAGRYTLIGPFEIQTGVTPVFGTDEEVGEGLTFDWTGTAIRTLLDVALPGSAMTLADGAVTAAALAADAGSEIAATVRAEVEASTVIAKVSDVRVRVERPL